MRYEELLQRNEWIRNLLRLFSEMLLSVKNAAQ